MRKTLILCVLLLANGCGRPFLVNTRIGIDDPVETHISGQLDTKVDGELRTVNKVIVDTPPVPDGGPIQTVSLRQPSSSGKRIAVVDVDGLIVNYPVIGPGSLGENPVALFREKLDAVRCDPNVVAVVVRINSPGGSVTATDILWHELKKYRQTCHVPVVACLMDVTAGGGYYIATAADQIVAHPTSVVGGIGVILNLYNLQDLMAQANILPQAIKSGDHIDLGSPVRNIPEEGRKILRAMATEYHERFIEVVKTARPSIEFGNDTFDGRVFTARDAMNRRLIDQVGYLDDAIRCAAGLANCPDAAPVLYRRANDTARSEYAVSPNVPIQSLILPSIPGLDRTRLPAFLYLWQPETSMERMGGR